MPPISITASGFQHGNATNYGTQSTNVSRLKCIKHATSVGYGYYSRMFGRNTTPVALASYRAMAVRCVLDFSHQQAIRLQRHYKNLETTEKSNLSYWIGMTFASIAASEVLGIVRLIHASKQQGVVKANQKSRSLADLVGQDQQSNFHIIEAKGRKSRPAPTQDDRDKWKDQANTISSINTTPITTSSYSVGFLGNPCSIEINDPPSTGGLDLRINPDDFGYAYYEPYYNFITAAPNTMIYTNRGFVLRPIGYDPISNDFVFLGLEKYFYEAAEHKIPLPINRVTEIDDATLYVAQDGIAVYASKGPCDLEDSLDVSAPTKPAPSSPKKPMELQTYRRRTTI